MELTNYLLAVVVVTIGILAMLTLIVPMLAERKTQKKIDEILSGGRNPVSK